MTIFSSGVERISLFDLFQVISSVETKLIDEEAFDLNKLYSAIYVLTV
jgi:hypothetical protein